MAKYMVRGSYTAEGTRGLASEGGSSRREAVEALVGGLGGSVEAMYYALGEDDVFVIVDLPDNASVAAVSLAAGASGAIDLQTTPLISPEELDEAAKKAVNYRPPGQ